MKVSGMQETNWTILTSRGDESISSYREIASGSSSKSDTILNSGTAPKFNGNAL
jgi:hypothetical protein